jgi:hypothetical protein
MRSRNGLGGNHGFRRSNWRRLLYMRRFGLSHGGRRFLGLRDGRCGHRLDRLDQARSQRRRRRLRRLGYWLRARLAHGFARGHGGFREERSVRQRDLSFARVTLDKLPRHDLFDGARCALYFDARVLFEQGDSLRARHAQQLRDLVHPDSGQTVSLTRTANDLRL